MRRKDRHTKVDDARRAPSGREDPQHLEALKGDLRPPRSWRPMSLRKAFSRDHRSAPVVPEPATQPPPTRAKTSGQKERVPGTPVSQSASCYRSSSSQSLASCSTASHTVGGAQQVYSPASLAVHTFASSHDVLRSDSERGGAASEKFAPAGLSVGSVFGSGSRDSPGSGRSLQEERWAEVEGASEVSAAAPSFMEHTAWQRGPHVPLQEVKGGNKHEAHSASAAARALDPLAPRTPDSVPALSAHLRPHAHGSGAWDELSAADADSPPATPSAFPRWSETGAAPPTPGGASGARSSDAASSTVIAELQDNVLDLRAELQHLRTQISLSPHGGPVQSHSNPFASGALSVAPGTPSSAKSRALRRTPTPPRRGQAGARMVPLPPSMAMPSPCGPPPRSRRVSVAGGGGGGGAAQLSPCAAGAGGDLAGMASPSSIGLSCGLPGLSHEVATTIAQYAAAEEMQETVHVSALSLKDWLLRGAPAASDPTLTLYGAAVHNAHIAACELLIGGVLAAIEDGALCPPEDLPAAAAAARDGGGAATAVSRAFAALAEWLAGLYKSPREVAEVLDDARMPTFLQVLYHEARRRSGKAGDRAEEDMAVTGGLSFPPTPRGGAAPLNATDMVYVLTTAMCPPLRHLLSAQHTEDDDTGAGDGGDDDTTTDLSPSNPLHSFSSTLSIQGGGVAASGLLPGGTGGAGTSSSAYGTAQSSSRSVVAMAPADGAAPPLAASQREASVSTELSGCLGGTSASVFSCHADSSTIPAPDARVTARAPPLSQQPAAPPSVEDLKAALRQLTGQAARKGAGCEEQDAVATGGATVDNEFIKLLKQAVAAQSGLGEEAPTAALAPPPQPTQAQLPAMSQEQIAAIVSSVASSAVADFGGVHVRRAMDISAQASAEAQRARFRAARMERELMRQRAVMAAMARMNMMQTHMASAMTQMATGGMVAGAPSAADVNRSRLVRSLAVRNGIPRSQMVGTASAWGGTPRGLPPQSPMATMMPGTMMPGVPGVLPFGGGVGVPGGMAPGGGAPRRRHHSHSGSSSMNSGTLHAGADVRGGWASSRSAALPRRASATDGVAAAAAAAPHCMPRVTSMSSMPTGPGGHGTPRRHASASSALPGHSPPPRPRRQASWSEGRSAPLATRGACAGPGRSADGRAATAQLLRSPSNCSSSGHNSGSLGRPLASAHREPYAAPPVATASQAGPGGAGLGTSQRLPPMVPRQPQRGVSSDSRGLHLSECGSGGAALQQMERKVSFTLPEARWS